MTSEQRPPVNTGHYFCVPRVVGVQKLNSSDIIFAISQYTMNVCTKKNRQGTRDM